MLFFFVCNMRHAGISSVASFIKSSQTEYGAPLSHISVYGICGIFNRSIIFAAITSLNGCCLNGLLPPLIRQRFPFIIFQRFFRLPSEVLSGVLKLSAPVFLFPPNSMSPISSEKSLLKKFTSSQLRPDPSGHIQYWSERLSP